MILRDGVLHQINFDACERCKVVLACESQAAVPDAQGKLWSPSHSHWRWGWGQALSPMNGCFVPTRLLLSLQLGTYLHSFWNPPRKPAWLSGENLYSSWPSSAVIERGRWHGNSVLLLSSSSSSSSSTAWPFCWLYIYIYYIHPELRIWDCLFGSGKGAGPL